MSRITGIATAFILLCLGACATQAPVPEDRFYRLPMAGGQLKKGQALARVLVAGPLQARGIYNERAMLYIRGEQPLEVLRYHYHYWLQSPSQLVQEHMLSYLRNTGMANEVVAYGTHLKHDYQVSGRLLRFERLINRDGVSVIARIEFTLEKSGRPVLIRTYEHTLRVANDSMHATADAMGHALEQIYRQLVTDIRATVPGGA